MNKRSWGPGSFLPWVEGVALHIVDPVARLRFLKSAAPCVQSPAPVPRRSRIFKFVLELAVAVILILAFTMIFVWFVKTPIGTADPGTTRHHRAERNSAEEP